MSASRRLMALVLTSLAAASLALLLSGCSLRFGSPSEAIEVPVSLRSRAASDFPQFEIVEAAGHRDRNQGGGLTAEQVLFVLRHKSQPFYLIQAYGRMYRADPQLYGWDRQSEPGQMDFSGTPSPHAAGLIDFLVRRFPTGDVAFDELSMRDVQDSNTEIVQAGLVPVTGGLTNDGFLHGGRAELYVYDKSRGTWSIDE